MPGKGLTGPSYQAQYNNGTGNLKQQFSKTSYPSEDWVEVRHKRPATGQSFFNRSTPAPLGDAVFGNKKTPQQAPKAPQNPKAAQNAPVTPQPAHKAHQDVSKESEQAPIVPQNAPGAPQNALKATQKASKAPQNAPKAPPNAPKAPEETDKPRTNKLPEHLFLVAKSMTSVFKCTHHLAQTESSVIPKQIAKQTQMLKDFPKPFAPNAFLKTEIDHIADEWSEKLRLTLKNHYCSTRNSELSKLENCSGIRDLDWESCLNVAHSWTRSSFKRVSNTVLREGLELLKIARRKGLVQEEEAVIPNLEDTPSATHPVEVIEEDLIQFESLSILPGNSVNLHLPPIVNTNAVEIGLADELNQGIKFTDKAKKDWIFPDTQHFTKLLITDNAFVGPVTSDFFHVTFPDCNAWHLNNVLKRATPSTNLSLILIHVGNNSLGNETNWNYTLTVINKFKFLCPTAKVFFTSLFSKKHDSQINRFNSFCEHKIPGSFIRSNIGESEFNTEAEKSELLFQSWCKSLADLNCGM
jgi:hypothetical protein